MNSDDGLLKSLLGLGLNSAFQPVKPQPLFSQPPILLPPPKPVKKKVTRVESFLRMKGNLRKAASGQIVDGRVLPSSDEIGLTDGRRLQVAAMYADLRGFSNLVAQYQDKRVIRVLDTFVTEATKIVSDFGGEVVDCAGDRVLAAFAKPYKETNLQIIARKALVAGLWIQAIVDGELNGLLREMKYPTISCGVGVDVGPVVVTRVGIRNRNKIVFVGEPTNFAAKIESLAPAGCTNMSIAVYQDRPPYMTAENNWDFRRVDHQELGTFVSCCNTFGVSEVPIP